MDTDVLIAGAGPTGLMLACQLARRGIRAQIIDRHSGPAQQSRAIAVQARTLEVYSKLGIAEVATALGKEGTGANMWAEGRWMARIPLGEIGQGLSPFPYVLMLGQDDNEHIMGERLRDWGVKVQWNTELQAFEQGVDHMTAEVRQPDGSCRTVRAAYLAGCDGAHSAVRQLSGIGFPGAPYEHVFFVADTEAIGPMRSGEVNIYLWRDGFHLLFPMRGQDHWRIVGILPKELRQRETLTFEEVIPSIRQEAGSSLSFKSCSWFSKYRIHHRCAEHFRDRRAFLLGDAAHIHSPAGGQGMNTGLQDAYNLGWKLALVLSGKADASLLDTYEQERLPVAHRLLRTTDRAFKLLVSESWLAGLLRARLLARIGAYAMRFKSVQRLAFRTISQIGIRYPASRLSTTLPGLPEPAPRAGDRFPWIKVKLHSNGDVEDLYQALDDARFNLVIVGQPAPSFQASGDLRVHTVADDGANAKELERAQIPSPSFYLVRPDGHVALAGARLDASLVTRYFADQRLNLLSENAGQPLRVAAG